MKQTIRINLDPDAPAIAAAHIRPAGGLEEDAYEYAIHNINFDRATDYSRIQRDVVHARLFNSDEVEQDAFQKGVERALIEALKANTHLRGSVVWNR